MKNRLLLCAAVAVAVAIAGFVFLFNRGLFDIRLRTLDKTLAECPPDEVRVEQYYSGWGTMAATFNFSKKTLEGGDSAVSGYNINLGYGLPPLTDEQVVKIKNLLATLPPSKASATYPWSYRNQFHLAYYQNGSLRIYHYAPNEAQPDLVKLCEAICVPAHFTTGDADRPQQ